MIIMAVFPATCMTTVQEYRRPRPRDIGTWQWRPRPKLNHNDIKSEVDQS